MFATNVKAFLACHRLTANTLANFILYVNFFPYQNGATPLLVAAEKGHTEVAEMLLNAGANAKLQLQVLYIMSLGPLF